jgi:DNA primase
MFPAAKLISRAAFEHGRGIMEVPTNEKQRDYARYAEECLKQVARAPDQRSRSLLREMAAEWLRLADRAETEDTAVAAVANGRSNGHPDTGS